MTYADSLSEPKVVGLLDEYSRKVSVISISISILSKEMIIGLVLSLVQGIFNDKKFEMR